MEVEKLFKKLVTSECTVDFQGRRPHSEGFYVSIPSMSWCSAGEVLTYEVATGLWLDAHKAALLSDKPTAWSAPARPNGTSWLYAGHWTQSKGGVTHHWLDVNVWLPDEPQPAAIRSMMLEFANFQVAAGQIGWLPSRWQHPTPTWHNSDLARFVGRCWGQAEVWDIGKGIEDPLKGGLPTSFEGE